MRKILTLLALLSIGFTASAQASRHRIREGNRDYDKQRYEQAEVNYRKALERDSADYRGQYNLAGDLYRQERYKEAASRYQQALAAPDLTDKQRARALHNQGNSLLKSAMQSEQMEGLQQAVNSYQEALKLDPKNDDTRYNLAYARRLLQQQQQQQQQGGGQNQQQDQQKQDQQNQQQQQDQQGQSQPQNQDRQEPQRQPQPQQDRHKQDAQRMLDAVRNNERQALRDKEQHDKPVRVKKTDKDW